MLLVGDALMSSQDNELLVFIEVGAVRQAACGLRDAA